MKGRVEDVLLLSRKGGRDKALEALGEQEMKKETDAV